MFIKRFVWEAVGESATEKEKKEERNETTSFGGEIDPIQFATLERAKVKCVRERCLLEEWLVLVPRHHVLRSLCPRQEGPLGQDLAGGALGQEAHKGTRIRDKHRKVSRGNSAAKGKEEIKVWNEQMAQCKPEFRTTEKGQFGTNIGAFSRNIVRFFIGDWHFNVVLRQYWSWSSQLNCIWL
jgi:hypothetical protein